MDSIITNVYFSNINDTILLFVLCRLTMTNESYNMGKEILSSFLKILAYLARFSSSNGLTYDIKQLAQTKTEMNI
jgi:hypothetical protein